KRILDSAAQVFAHAGYRDTSMDAIAEASATSKGGVYFHFPTKHAIFLTLLERMAELLRSRIVAAMQEQDTPSARLDAAVGTMLRTFADHRALARLFLIDAWGAGRDVHQRLLEIEDQFVDLIAGQLQEAICAGAIEPIDVELVSVAWFGALYQIVLRWLVTGQPVRLEDASPALRSLLLRSVSLPQPTTKTEGTQA
ncbi:MAG: TetR/AcrR family transcriptional regulator, partial [Chloroflexi bacterium]|nr:TetR/AcrR family transcriptional regulator [Chloroflexota bacterium]